MIHPLYPRNRRRASRRWRRHEPQRRLVFSPLAWLKLMYYLHAGDTEVGGFAVTAADDPLYVRDVLTLSQQTTVASIALDDSAVADHFDRCVDAGLRPENFARLWWHTHPGQSPQPSSVDEDTFTRVFGACDWSIMFIVSRTGRTYTRLAFNTGPGGQVLLHSGVDWAAWPITAAEQPYLDLPGWQAEYLRNVHPIAPTLLADRPELDSGWERFPSREDDWLGATAPRLSAGKELIG